MLIQLDTTQVHASATKAYTEALRGQEVSVGVDEDIRLQFIYCKTHATVECTLVFNSRDSGVVDIRNIDDAEACITAVVVLTTMLRNAAMLMVRRQDSTQSDLPKVALTI